ncbi:hypothetical protein NN3_64010 [Nocardia neocaledoniensis NBRC 108232]|uniref:Uncharacterized protein n=1 Tax=Nocardia neocaledoniensis TaxID=236511 RepID=A0A317NSA7_9NOCA|nr:hypothetical protein [Nocardia neocaledoniensis]PWV77832.1 hypothetical protein DFR69_103432 [Nocardia neocaledoniensis]GEM35394.1 hypothetical protein NN3_64010 [Nocardia neocaledoniensis NBRC 108232]
MNARLALLAIPAMLGLFLAPVIIPAVLTDNDTSDGLGTVPTVTTSDVAGCAMFCAETPGCSVFCDEPEPGCSMFCDTPEVVAVCAIFCNETEEVR